MTTLWAINYVLLGLIAGVVLCLALDAFCHDKS